jgi:hypothetical protein
MSEKAKGNKSFSGRKHTEETKKKMSVPRPNRRGIPAWNKGTSKFKTLKEKERHFNLRKYGIDGIEYNRILSIQNNVCAICLKPETKKHQNGKIIGLSVDHCHSTNKVRGLLCRKCNFAIGQLDDNPYLCERAMKYLLTNQ